MGIYLALGSNLGNREDHLQRAFASLGERGIKVWKAASLYSTEPRNLEEQPWFLNTVIEVRTLLEPNALLAQCLEIEKDAGRVREVPNGPRSLDIDILLYGDRIIDEPGLLIPHPRFRERRFVLVPLAEIAPDVTDPVCGLTIQQLLDFCPDRGIVQVHRPPLL